MLAGLNNSFGDRKYVAHYVAQIVELFDRQAGEEDRLFQLPLQPLAVRRAVLGNQHAALIDRYGEDIGHAHQDRRGLLVWRIVEVEAHVLVLHGIVEDCANPVGGGYLTKQVFGVSAQMEALSLRARAQL